MLPPHATGWLRTNHRARQDMQAYARHPYANTGFGAAFLVGIAAWWFVSSSKEGKPAPPPQPAKSTEKP